MELSGENDNILHYFNELDAEYCTCSASGSFGEVQDTAKGIKIKTIEFETTPNLTPGNLKGVEIANANISCKGDYSFLRGLEDINIDVNMDDCGSIQVDFDGLHIGNLYVHSKTHKASTLTIKGKYELKDVVNTWWSIIEGYIPSKVESYRGDHLGSMLPHFKQVDTLYWNSVQSFNDYDIEAFEKIVSGKIKINTVKHFQHPYPTISMEDFIRRFQINIAMNRGYTQYGSEWGAHDLDKESFRNWLESQTKYEIVETKEGDEGTFDSLEYYVICDKSTRVPVGIYYAHTRNVWKKLYTDDKKLLTDVI